jgi:hypothetical protein
MIRTVEDLKAALSAPDSTGPRGSVVRSINEWLPGLVETLPWRSRLTRHFLLQCYDHTQADHAFTDSLAELLERIHTELTAFFGIAARTKQERLILQGRLTCFVIHIRYELTPGMTVRTFGTVLTPQSLFDLIDPEANPYYEQHLRHEISHLVWGRLYSEAPALFNEGLAVYAENVSAPNATLDAFFDANADVLAQSPPLADIAFNDNFWRHDESTMYRLGGVLVAYLVERWGWEKLRDLFLVSDYEDPDILDHFSEVYGQELSAVDTELRQYLASRMG